MMAEQIASGHLKVPDYMKLVNTPTLWTYYETLPKWARNDPVVRNVMMAMEYKQPHLGIREKENALNFACSFLRPIDKQFRILLTEAVISNKIQMNMKKGTKMLTELQFYTLDIDWLGSESEDYESDENEDVLDSLLRSNKAAAEEDEEMTPMKTALLMMDDDNRREDMRKYEMEDMNIEKYKVQPAINQCLTDFATFEEMGLDDVETEVAGDRENGIKAEELPLNYYDNDDGYWDNHIEYKRTRGQEAGFLTRRLFFKH